jgi:NTE family protein
MERICNAVFEGGGVRGVGLAGAVAALEESGVRFSSVAGTSVGAIVAALLAAGFTSKEMRDEIGQLNFKQFKYKGDKISFFKMLMSVNHELGLYDTGYFETWLAGLLRRKGVVNFGDLKRPLKVTAVDTTDNRLLVLPDDLARFGIDPKKFSVAAAVRMSISIPLFFKPTTLRDTDGRTHLIVDGGVLSNNPAWLLEGSQYPLINFRFEKNPKHKNTDGETRPNIVEYIQNIIGLVLDDSDSVRNKGGEQIIYINTVVRSGKRDKEIQSVNFDITREESDALYQNGYLAGREFITAQDVQRNLNNQTF